MAGFIVQPHKSNALAIGLDTHVTTRVTEPEVVQHARKLYHVTISLRDRVMRAVVEGREVEGRG